MDKKQKHYAIWYIIESVIWLIVIITGASILLMDIFYSFYFQSKIFSDPHFILLMFSATIFGLVMLKIGEIKKKIDGVI